MGKRARNKQRIKNERKLPNESELAFAQRNTQDEEGFFKNDEPIEDPVSGYGV